MSSRFAFLAPLLFALSTAQAAVQAEAAAEPERVGPLGIIIFLLVFVVSTVAMIGIAFWKKGGKSGDKHED